MNFRFFLILISISLNIFVHSQENKFFHNIEKDETIYKLSIIYEVPIDSIFYWNNLDSELLLVGQKVLIYNYNNLNPLRIQRNYHVHDVISLNTELSKLELEHQVALENVKILKSNIIDADIESMQKLFSIAKFQKFQEEIFETSSKILNDDISFHLAKIDSLNLLLSLNNRFHSIFLEDENLYFLNKQIDYIIEDSIQQANKESKILSGHTDQELFQSLLPKQYTSDTILEVNATKSIEPILPVIEDSIILQSDKNDLSKNKEILDTFLVLNNNPFISDSLPSFL